MTSVKLYLDEDVDPLLAKVLHNREHDVITTQEANMLSSPDDAQFAFAISQERAFFTHNVKHFVKIAERYAASGESHFGIIVSDQVPFKELLKRTLRLLNRHTAETIQQQLIWLHDFKFEKLC